MIPAILAITLAATGAGPDGTSPRLLAPLSLTTPQPLGSPSVADDTFLKVRGGGIILFQSGSVTVGDDVGGGAISILDFTDVLNQDESDVSPFGSVAVAIPAIDVLIEAGYLGSYTYEGATSGITIGFDGQTYTGDIASTSSYNIYEFNALWEALELSVFKVHIGAGVRFFDVEGEVSGTVSGTAASDSASAIVPLPILAAGVRADIGPNFFISGRIGGMVYGDFGNIIDGSVEIGWDFVRNAGIFAGYRVIAAESDAFDIEFDLTLQGPYAGIELRL